MPQKVDIADEDRVDLPISEYLLMQEKWALLETLLGGTLAMRAAKTDYLPQENKESIERYEARLLRSVLYNGYGDTIEKIAGKPFTKPVVITKEDTLPEQLQPLSTNMDGSGTSITEFGKAVFKAGAVYGFTHVLVDYPKVDLSGTLADERQLGARPIFVHIKPPDLIGWRVKKLLSGKLVLTQIRIKESHVEPYGLFGEIQVHYVRVYNESTWELWRQDPEDQTFYKVDEGNHTYGGVPLRTCYFEKTGFMLADPPLEDLAWLNLAHWQSYSDHRNILKFARVGILFASGFTEDEIDKGIVIAPGSLVGSSNPAARLQYVEHSGAAIQAGERDLTELTNRMETLGLQPLAETSKGSTATGKALDETKSRSAIQAWIGSVQDCLLDCYQSAAQWIGAEISDEFAIQIYSEFALLIRADLDMNVLTQMRAGGDLDRETLLNESKRRGFISETVDVQDIIDRLDQEGPPAGLLTAGGTNGTQTFPGI